MRRSISLTFWFLACLCLLVPAQALAGRPAQVETATLTEENGPAETPTFVADTPAPTLEPPVDSPTATQVSAAGFQVTGVEPARISGEAGGPISIYGASFEPGTAVRLVGFGLLDSAVINATAIRAMVPPGLKKGSYALDIILPDGTSAYVENAFRIAPAKEPTPTATVAGRPSVFAQPQMVVEEASTVPEVLRPGSPFTLHFKLSNQGGYTAANVQVSLGPSSLAVPREGSSLLLIDRLLGQQSVDLSLPLALNTTAPAGYQSLELVIDYYDYLGQPFQSSQSVGVRINSNLAAQPLVLLSAYRTEPEALSPGDTFTLDLEITNAGKNDAEQVLVTLGGEGGAGIKPFAILGTSNVVFLPRLASGESAHVEHRLILDGAAASGVYDLPVNLAYDDLNEERRTESHLINLLVNRRPQIQVNFYRTPEAGLVGQPLALPIEMVNIGRSTVNISTAEISGEDLEITTGSAYIGVLDGGTTGTLDAEIIPKKSGSLPVQVSVHYLDDFNQPQVHTQTLAVQVSEPEKPSEPEAEGEEQENSLGAQILRIVRGLLGLGS